jgi:hypothetical protein
MEEGQKPKVVAMSACAVVMDRATFLMHVSKCEACTKPGAVFKFLDEVGQDWNGNLVTRPLPVAIEPLRDVLEEEAS